MIFSNWLLFGRITVHPGFSHRVGKGCGLKSRMYVCLVDYYVCLCSKVDFVVVLVVVVLRVHPG